VGRQGERCNRPLLYYFFPFPIREGEEKDRVVAEEYKIRAF
jgi:hypothetical protein